MPRSRNSAVVTFRFALVLALAVAAGCNDSTSPAAPREMTPSLARGGQQGPDLRAAMAARARYSARIMARHGVEGIGVGLTDKGDPAVVIMTTNGAIGGLPRALDGVPVKLVPTGPFSAVLPRAG